MEFPPIFKRMPRRARLAFYALCLIFTAGAMYSYSVQGGFKSAADLLESAEAEDSQKQSLPERLTPERRITEDGFVAPNRRFGGRSSLAEEISFVPGLMKESPAETKYIYLNTSSDRLTSSPSTQPYSTTQPPRINSCHLSSKDSSKLILLWTPFFDSWDYLPSGPFRNCPTCPNCYVTTDRKRLLQSHAVVFHCRDMTLVDLPTTRLPHQRWIFYCLESPPYSDFQGMHFMHGMFNWTMTYRLESDIVTQYGSVQKSYPAKNLDMGSLAAAWSSKTKTVVWMSSHCPTHGGRDEFVQEMSKYIDVDEYGSCGLFDCAKDETSRCMEEFADKYKFFLAFENTICKDYITEKFFRTLKYDIVPVVFGGAKYSKFVPPGAYIDALSFKSPKHLAFFLAGVGSNFDLYSSYFQWKKDHVVRMVNRKDCDLCALLHRNDSKPSIYSDLRKWWVHDSKCRTWKSKT